METNLGLAKNTIMKTESGNLAVVTNRRTISQYVPSEAVLFDLILGLQTSLEVDTVLDIFDRHLQVYIPHTEFGFSNDRLGISRDNDRRGKHNCRYTLMLEDNELGEYWISRDQRFSAMDLECMEAFLCRLLYPLRNALRYREALYFARTDPLTQTGNRSALLHDFQHEQEFAQRYGLPLSMIFLDIDHFKNINDEYGHDAGDEVLRAIGRNAKQNIRASDKVYRYGGEEFVMLLRNTTSDGARHLAERIREAIDRLPCQIGLLSLHVTASLGVASLNPGETCSELLKRADQAMYTAKHRGRNRVEAAMA